ncbi:hypothetical protein AXE65_04865 [Ventosimonas gracilis]|uniref:Uncharacterized protein n=1 Tax=Ventosimonas gracilis TaxID=1680762 RepID=A0A139SPM6_9GAMM|nr:hypothetical protein [Ventosimonas gracilis]KXU36506.1 hypothetical protein AXE65_04865 [Ventosimonas gracilis]
MIMSQEEFERFMSRTEILATDDEPLTEEERQTVEALRTERENYDEKADLRERVEAKLQAQADNPGLVVEFDPDEAEHLGLFEETAMSFEDAWAARFDDVAPDDGAP